MTDAELDALLANAKPYPLPMGGIIPNEKFAWMRWGNRPVEVPQCVLWHLKCDRFDKFNYIYATEAAAMDALRIAVEAYKRKRDAIRMVKS